MRTIISVGKRKPKSPWNNERKKGKRTQKDKKGHHQPNRRFRFLLLLLNSSSTLKLVGNTNIEVYY